MARKEAGKKEGCEMAGKNGDLEIVLKRSQSSVTVKRDAKQVLSYEIKVYADDIGSAVEGAEKAKIDLEKRLGMAE